MGLFTRGLELFKRKHTFTADEFIFKYIENGGSNEMNVLGTVGAPVKFEYIVPNGKSVWLRILNIMAIDGSIQPANFFGISALTNGMKFEIRDVDNNLLQDFTNGNSLKRTLDFALFAGSDAANIIDRGGPTDDGAAIRWTFKKAGEDIFMREGSRFVVTIEDDLTGITALRMMLQGIIVNKF